MKKKKGRGVIREMIAKYKWNLLFQTGVFAVLMALVLTWEPVVLKVVFGVIEIRQADRLLLCGGGVGIALLLLFLIGYLNNTYVDMDRWRIIYRECEEALRRLPELSFDEVNRRFSEGGIFERIYGLGQAKMGMFFHSACIGIYVLVGALLLGNVRTAGIGFAVAVAGMLVLQLLLLKVRSILAVRYEKVYRKAEEEGNTGGSHMIQDLPFILMNHLEEQEIHDFHMIRKAAFDILRKQKLWEAFFQGLETCLVVSMKALLAVWIFPLALGSGLLTAVFATVDKLKMLVSAVAENVIETKRVAVAVHRYAELEACTPDVPQDTKEAEELISLSDAGLQIDGRIIFANRELQIRKGDKVAIVGPNGCGKSSVLKVMAGLYHLTEGELRRKQDCRIAYVPAKACLFAGTGEENIKMSGQDSRKKTEETPDFWFCYDFLEKQVDQMSGGQQQRINIARGLYRDADLVLADEPTSHLDQEASRQVMETFLKCTDTCVVITHDGSLLDLFTKVIALKERETE